MEAQHLAISSVPVQQWSGRLYEYTQALRTGTIFPELNLPFFAADTPIKEEPSLAADTPVKEEPSLAADTPVKEESLAADSNKTPEQQQRECLLSKINAISFFLDDLVLYLDTHPNQQEAIALRKQVIEERKRLLKEFDQNNYPLTKDCEGLWTEGPMPWEGACI